MENPTENKITIYFDGKPYLVPADLTIMTAMEYAGFRLVRGCGCRHGFCGACGTIYRIKGKNQLFTALACQTQVEEGMYVASLPFFPVDKKNYAIEELTPHPDTMMALFPEIFACVACNACTNSCSRSLNVMQYIAYAKRNDLEQCAHTSFDCVNCCICSSRCPANISHPLVGLLARRLTGKYIQPPAQHNTDKVEAIKNGQYDTPLAEMMAHDTDTLRALYNAREIEA